MEKSYETILREIVEAFNSPDSDKEKLEKQLRNSLELDKNVPYKKQIESKLGRQLQFQEIFVISILEKQKDKVIKKRRPR